LEKETQMKKHHSESMRGEMREEKREMRSERPKSTHKDGLMKHGAMKGGRLHKAIHKGKSGC
jgi:hypothetical protein